MKTREILLSMYAGVLTIAFGALVLMGARKPANASFDQITVHRINVVEPDGTTRMVLSDKAEFPGFFYMGKEHPRPDRIETGILFNDDEGSENGGLIFGGSKDKQGVTHSYGHLSFDNYQRDQVLALESNNDGDERHVYYGLNDDDRPHPLTPGVIAEYEHAAAQPAGPVRDAAVQAWKMKYPGGIIQRGYLGREKDKSVALVLKDPQGHARLVARVRADGTPTLEFLGPDGQVLRQLDATGH